jgi:hypothetical protein
MGNSIIKQKSELVEYTIMVMTKYLQSPDKVSLKFIGDLNVALSNIEISLLESEIMERTPRK